MLGRTHEPATRMRVLSGLQNAKLAIGDAHPQPALFVDQCHHAMILNEHNRCVLRKINGQLLDNRGRTARGNRCAGP